MTLWPRSLSGRLLGISALTTVAALAFAALAIGQVLERFVIRSLDQQLDAEALMLARAVRPDGVLDQRRIVNLPAFDTAGEGWGWRVEGARGRWSGGDAMSTPLAPDLRPASPVRAPAPPPPPPPRPHEEDRAGGSEARPGDGVAASGERVHVRQLSVPTAAGPVLVVASAPRRVALAPLREALLPLLGSLALLGVALALATTVQLRFGLRPLRQLRAALVEVRTGRRRRVPAEQPDELAPLAAELNSLLDQNEAQLEHARRHVANLAHGLKTPLAALAIRLAESGRDPDGSLGAVVAEIDGRVRHHLGRARAAAPGGGQRARTMLAAAIADLTGVMHRVHAERSRAVSVAVDPNLIVAVDPQDLDEMIGNLLDNAWRHARSAIRIKATIVGAKVELAIEDDGPGLSDEAIGQALVRGRRLDESGDGHGFGLSITQELAELGGGTLALGRSTSLGGLRVALMLPAGAAPP